MFACTFYNIINQYSVRVLRITQHSIKVKVLIMINNNTYAMHALSFSYELAERPLNIYRIVSTFFQSEIQISIVKYSRSRSYNANITNPIESLRTVQVYRRSTYDRCVSTKGTIDNFEFTYENVYAGMSFVRYHCLIAARCSELL